MCTPELEQLGTHLSATWGSHVIWPSSSRGAIAVSSTGALVRCCRGATAGGAPPQAPC